jgi:hypothetical protein
MRARTFAWKVTPSPRGDTERERRQSTGRQLDAASSVLFSASQSMRSRSPMGTSRWMGGGGSTRLTVSTSMSASAFVRRTRWPCARAPAPSTSPTGAPTASRATRMWCAVSSPSVTPTPASRGNGA